MSSRWIFAFDAVKNTDSGRIFPSRYSTSTLFSSLPEVLAAFRKNYGIGLLLPEDFWLHNCAVVVSQFLFLPGNKLPWTGTLGTDLLFPWEPHFNGTTNALSEGIKETYIPNLDRTRVSVLSPPFVDRRLTSPVSARNPIACILSHTILPYHADQRAAQNYYFKFTFLAVHRIPIHPILSVLQGLIFSNIALLSSFPTASWS
ncbi:hypothetical protein AFLA_008911 [Aspergillus flavus NRRL3357]|nr:hypothetical protein AFLA_008911 [Aspergillus flavus NRRL3357]